MIDSAGGEEQPVGGPVIAPPRGGKPYQPDSGLGIMKDFAVVYKVLALVLVLGATALAQSDPFGQVDLVYGDSLRAAPGQDVSLRFFIRHDEALSSFSVPLVYNPQWLTLTGVSFAGSRFEAMQTKLVNPAPGSITNGHFVVAVIRITEAPVAPGEGTLFTLNFRIAGNAPLGAVATVDSLFFPPGGDFLLAEAETASGIRPAFRKGKILIATQNRPPQITPIAPQFVSEGQPIQFFVQVTDPDPDQLWLASLGKPLGSTVLLDGTLATFSWTPDFVGPASSVNSPYNVTFRAGDGSTTVDYVIPIVVYNANRPPLLSGPTLVNGRAGQPVSFEITANEPDFEPVEWSIDGQPATAAVGGANVSSFQWLPQLSDSGTYDIRYIAADPQGAADTIDVSLSIRGAELYTLSLDTVAIDLGLTGPFDVSLTNILPVCGYNLLIKYDATALGVDQVVKTGTRSDGFEYFTYRTNDGSRPGHLRIEGRGALAGTGNRIAPGTGPIARLTFRGAANIDLSGMNVPIQFAFLDAPDNNDNTLLDSVAVKVASAGISYANGSVLLNTIGTIRIGDINLNGLAYDVGDVVLFTNHIVQPGRYPFSLLQYANSDINGDKLVATITDLVRMIQIIIGDAAPGGKLDGEEPRPVLITQREGAVHTIAVDSDVEIGAVLLTFEGGNMPPADVSSTIPGIDLVSGVAEGSLRVLLYSMQGQAIPAGAQELVSLTGHSGWRLSRAEIADSDGRSLATTLASVALPAAFELEQNYPNPFNPSTRISFALPQGDRVRLTIYDVLGRQVRMLADGEYPAGRHELEWDGRDSDGAAVASGVYFYKLETAGQSATRKMLLVK